MTRGIASDGISTRTSARRLNWMHSGSDRAESPQGKLEPTGWCHCDAWAEQGAEWEVQKEGSSLEKRWWIPGRDASEWIRVRAGGHKNRAKNNNAEIRLLRTRTSGLNFGIWPPRIKIVIAIAIAMNDAEAGTSHFLFTGTMYGRDLDFVGNRRGMALTLAAHRWKETKLSWDEERREWSLNLIRTPSPA
ncbi:hypothetical protein C8R44DRAFT_754735 [Mycena epipterygia]|nr:hypothetical protein C8R44DRAFT_754735 [Mycena epipterygia]